MLPLIGSIPTQFVLLGLALACALFIFGTRLRGRVPFWLTTALVAMTAVAAVVGARLLHVVWEAPEHFRAHPEEILTRFDGLVFYGGLFGGALAFGIAVQSTPILRRHRPMLWDSAAFACALGVAWLRLACFAHGCCWGSVTAVPWAVRYMDERSVMPYLGIPVHPVQLYESLAAFALGSALWRIDRARLAPGHLMSGFGLGYAGIRILTEIFRGDALRGTQLLWGLSTSQILSLGLAAAIVGRWMMSGRRSVDQLKF
jgi:phosphatidylglycerol:prolipoprotein diacylglycerol transferase